VLAREARDAADVVGVLVGHDHGVHRVRLDAEAAQAGLGLAQHEAAVHQHRGRAGLDQRAVAAAAAAQHRKTHQRLTSSMPMGLREKNGGEGGIRTPGTLRYNGFRDRRIKPLCHLSVILENAL
jgi:hypothetical protein